MPSCSSRAMRLRSASCAWMMRCVICVYDDGASPFEGVKQGVGAGVSPVRSCANVRMRSMSASGNARGVRYAHRHTSSTAPDSPNNGSVRKLHSPSAATIGYL